MKSALNSDLLLDALRRMDHRVRQIGLERYDPGDVLSHPVFLGLRNERRLRAGYYLLRLADHFVPLLFRRVLQVKPVLVPTTLFHLGMCYLRWEKIEPSQMHVYASRVDEICQLALARRLAGNLCAWSHPHSEHGDAWRCDDLRLPGVPDSCCHHTSRIGLLLLRVGIAHNKHEFVVAARSAADALLQYHNWHLYADGACTISYYPDTDDETINTGAEAAALLALLPRSVQREEHRAKATGLVEMVIREQGESGEWRYTTRRHENRRGPSGDPDNHHTAMNLAALADVLGSGVLQGRTKDRTLEALQRGLQFYMDQFVAADGRCGNEIGRTQPACIAGYCEGVKMMLAVLALPGLQNQRLKVSLSVLVPEVLNQAYRLYFNARTGDVGSSCRFAKTQHLKSIRWGAGLLMDATTEFLAAQAKGHLLQAA